MSKLTDFQVQCETVLSDALERSGTCLSNRRLEGVHELYVIAEIPAHRINVWIYRDEPELVVGDRSFIYEVPDYPDESKRIAAFVNGVMAVVGEGVPIDTGSKRAMLFKGRKL